MLAAHGSRRSPAPDHLAFLDGLRGLSAVYVAACHAYLTCSALFWAQAETTWDRGALYALHWLSFGRSAVAVFIVISGYCLMLPVVRHPEQAVAGGLARFFRRRARRILPPYYGALALSLLVLWAVPALGRKPGDPWFEMFWSQVYPALEWGVVLSHVALVHNYHPAWQHAINYPMWSIATEWQIYALFPVLVAIWRRNWRSGLVMNALRLTLVLQVSLVFFAPGHNPWPPVFVALFAFGMAAAARAGQGEGVAARAATWERRAALGLGSYLVLEVLVGQRLLESGHQQVLDFLVGGGAAALMIACAERTRRGESSVALRVLESRAAVGLGRFSYSLYLMHAPMLALVFVALRAAELANTTVLVLMVTLGLAVAVLASYGFFLVFERPFLRRSAPTA